MGEKMRNAPIFYTLAQIRFNTILDMHKHIESLQAALRKSGLSGFSMDDMPSIQVDTSTVPPKLTHATQQRWRFANSRKTAELILFNNSITYQTTTYDTEDEFISRILDTAAIVHNQVSLDFVDHIGFRTLDAVIPDDQHPLEGLLRPELLGFYLGQKGDLKQSHLEATFQIGSSGALVRRVVILHGQLGLPIDLMPVPLQIDPRFTSIDSWHAILDTDSAERVQFDFDLDEIGSRLRAVKDLASKAFRDAVTETALALWR